jgi:hypothetical protein
LVPLGPALTVYCRARSAAAVPGTGEAIATSGDVLMIEPPVSRCEWGRLSELDRWCLRCGLDVGVEGREAADWRIDSPAVHG